jgi:hypothetical protein
VTNDQAATSSSGVALKNNTANKSTSGAPPEAANEPMLPKQKNGLPRYSVILRPEITELVRLFFGAHDIGAHFGVKIQVLQNESIVDKEGNTKLVDAVCPEPIDNEDASKRCEHANRFLQSWHAHNAMCLDEDKMESEKSLGEWLVVWKKQRRS